jgi:hypothetical protein
MPKQSNNSDLVRYAGMGAQIFSSLAISVFVGYKADKWMNLRIPLLVWLLPFVVLVMMIYKLVKDTKRKN